MCSNVEIRQLDLLDECAFDVVDDSEPIDLVVAADMIYDEVLTESLCRVISFTISQIVSLQCSVSSSLPRPRFGRASSEHR